MQTTTIPITLQLNISLPDGVNLAPHVLTEADAWQYTAAPAGGGNPITVDLCSREPVNLEVQAVVEREEAAHASVETNATSTPADTAPVSEERNPDIPHASHSSLSLRAHPSESKTPLTAHTSDPLGSIISEQNIASSDAERKLELEKFLASIPDVLPASANIHDRDLQFLGKLLRGQLNEDLERRSTTQNGRAAKKESAADISRAASAHGFAERKDATPPNVPDDATHASVETNATNTPSVNGKATDAPTNYDTRGAVIGRLFNAHERLRAEVRELREELARTQAALVANAPRGASAPRIADLSPRELLAATKNVLSQDKSAKSDATNGAANAHAAHATPTPRAAKEAKKNDDPFDVEIASQSVFTIDGVELSPRRRHAIILLCNGATFGQAAAKVGVCRQTVHNWMRLDPAFQAIYNTYRNELRESAEAVLYSCIDKAARNYEAQVEFGNFRASEKLLRGLGLLTGKPAERDCESAAELAAELAAHKNAPQPAAEPQFQVQRHTLNGHAEKLEV